MDRKKYVFEASDDVKKVIAMGVTRGGAIWTDTMDVENFEELNSDYINEHFSDLQDTAYKKGLHDGESKCRYCNEYQRGLDDAWEAARKIVLDRYEGGTSIDELTEIFGRCTIQQVFRKYTVSEAIAKLKAYEEKQKAEDEIEVRDEVIAYGCRGVVTYVHKNLYTVMMSDGSCGNWGKGELKKTGKKHDIDKIMEALKG